MLDAIIRRMARAARQAVGFAALVVAVVILTVIYFVKG